MAKKSSKVEEASTRQLPVPEPLLKHHLQSLEPLMQKWVESERVPPVILLSGPSGIGKYSMAHFLGQWLQCSKSFSDSVDDQAPSLFGDPEPVEAALPKFSLPCGECTNCRRNLDAQYLEWLSIEPSVGATGANKSTKIAQVEPIHQSLGRAPHQSAHRVTIIRDIEWLTHQAANSLLKIIEEPPNGWVFVLTCSHQSKLLATIASRCQQFRLQPLPEQTLLELLNSQTIDPADAKLLSYLAQGSWGRCQDLLQSDWKELRNLVFSHLRDPARFQGDLIDWSSSSLQKLELLMDQYEIILEDLLAWSFAPDHYRFKNTDGQSPLNSFAKNHLKQFASIDHLRQHWMELTSRLIHSRNLTGTPVSNKLIAQELVGHWMA